MYVGDTMNRTLKTGTFSKLKTSDLQLQKKTDLTVAQSLHLQSVMILIITDFILGRVEAEDVEDQHKKKRILMDECWELLKGKASSQFMEYCVRTLRKKGAGITFITQGIEEIATHEIGLCYFKQKGH